MRNEKDNLLEVLRGPRTSFYVKQWIDYQANHQNREKLLHDIRLTNGSEFSGYYPNGSGWFKFRDSPGPGRISDNEVAFIRLSEKQMWD